MSTSYQPILLGANVRRGGESTVDVWDNFFNNASNVFNTSTENVIPYQAYLSTGDANSAPFERLNVNRDHPANLDMTNDDPGMVTQGAMRWKPTGSFSPLSVSDYGASGPNEADGTPMFPKWNEWHNTPEHEYLHGIDRYFGNYKDGFGGITDQKKWMYEKDEDFDWFNYAYKNIPAIDKDDDGYDDRNGDYVFKDYLNPSDPGYIYSKRNNIEKAGANPEQYAYDLSTSLTGYGGPSGEYELKEMLNHWERFGGQQWSFDPNLADERGYGDPNAYVKNSDQEDALRAAFMNNPNNDRLGDAKGPMANVVAQALSDGKYQSELIGKSLTLAERRELEAEGKDPYEAFNYWNLGEERFARLAAQYMKMPYIPEFEYNGQTEAGFRDAMNYLLEREATKGIEPFPELEGNTEEANQTVERQELPDDYMPDYPIDLTPGRTRL